MEYTVCLSMSLLNLFNTCKIFVALKNSSDMEKFLADFTNSMIDEKNNTFSWYLLYVLKFYPPHFSYKVKITPPPQKKRARLKNLPPLKKPPPPPPPPPPPLERNKRSVPYNGNNHNAIGLPIAWCFSLAL